MYHIYQITNIVNSKRYIGFTTKSVVERWKRHVATAKNGSSSYLHKAIRKYGIENFTIKTLCWGEDKDDGLKLAEPLLIEIYIPEYNQTAGGDGTLGRTCSEETRAKIKAARANQIITEETKRKMSQSHRGINTWSKGRTPWNAGKKYSKEVCEQMSLVRKGQIPWNKGETGLQVPWNKGIKRGASSCQE